MAPTVLRTKALRPSHRLALGDLAQQLSNWEAETNFYHRLLTWSLLGCKETDRPSIEAFLAQVNRLRSADLPTLKTQLGFMQAALEPASEPVRPDTFALRARFNHVEQKLQALKLHIFEGFPRFGRVEIW